MHLIVVTAAIISSRTVVSRGQVFRARLNIGADRRIESAISSVVGLGGDH